MNIHPLPSTLRGKGPPTLPFPTPEPRWAPGPGGTLSPVLHTCYSLFNMTKKTKKKPTKKEKIEISKYLIFFFIIWQSCIPSPLPNLARSCILNPVHLYLNVVPLPPWEREALSGHGGCYKSGGGGFFVLFCSFKISSQNQRFPNDCINSKQTNKPKTKGVFSTKPTCEAGLAWGSRTPGQQLPAPGWDLGHRLGREAGASQVGWGAEDLGAGLAALLGALTLWGLGDVD